MVVIMVDKKDDGYLEFPEWTEKQTGQPSAESIEKCAVGIDRKYHSVGMLERLLVADIDSFSLVQLTEQMEELKDVVGWFCAEIDAQIALKEDMRK